MSISPSIVSISSTSATPVTGPIKMITLQNIDASATIYIGDTYVTSSSFGLKLTPGQAICLNNVNGYLYAVASSTANLAKLASK